MARSPGFVCPENNGLPFVVRGVWLVHKVDTSAFVSSVGASVGESFVRGSERRMTGEGDQASLVVLHEPLLSASFSCLAFFFARIAPPRLKLIGCLSQFWIGTNFVRRPAAIADHFRLQPGENCAATGPVLRAGSG